MPPRWSDIGPHDYVPKKGTKGQGHTYERKVGRLLQRRAAEWGWTLHSQRWITDGTNWHQPDHVLQCRDNRAILFECKRTWIDSGAQLEKYQRLLLLMGIVTTPVLVCRNLRPGFCGDLCTSFEDLSPSCVWHLLL